MMMIRIDDNTIISIGFAFLTFIILTIIIGGGGGGGGGGGREGIHFYCSSCVVVV